MDDSEKHMASLTYEILFVMETNVCTASGQFDNQVQRKISTAIRVWNESDDQREIRMHDPTELPFFFFYNYLHSSLNLLGQSRRSYAFFKYISYESQSPKLLGILTLVNVIFIFMQFYHKYVYPTFELAVISPYKQLNYQISGC